MFISPALMLLMLLAQQDDRPSATRKLIEKLHSEKIEEREQAVGELRKAGPLIVDILKAALGQEQDPEVRARLEHILDSFVATRICNGAYPVLSPSGSLLSCQRWVEDPTQFDMRGNKTWARECWVRDLASNREWCVAKGTRATAWRDERTLRLTSGTEVDGSSGKSTSELVQPPQGLQTKNVRWSPDGLQLVCVMDAMFFRANPQLKPPVDVEGGLCWVGAKGEPQVLPLGHKIFSDGSGFLSWSPDGQRLAFDLMFFRAGNVPRRRIGIVEVATGKVSYVGESEYCHFNWGHNRNEGTGTAQELWDRRGERFVFVTGRGNGEGEISVSSADGSVVVRLTDDGLCKWSPVLDPAGRRVAFASAKWGGENGSLLEGHIRVLDLLTGEEERFQPSEKGDCLTLVWSPDGTRLFYDWSGDGTSSTIYEAHLPPAKSMPEGSPIKGKGSGSKK